MGVVADWLDEDFFPGNRAAYDKAFNLLQDKRLFIFTGSGTSSPLLPTWKPLLISLVGEAKRQGFLNSRDSEELTALIDSDMLAVADELERVFSPTVFRARLSNIFREIDGKYLESHHNIVAINPRGIITLNYDRCLESAYAKIHSKNAHSIKLCDQSDAVRWSQGDIFDADHIPIMHLHGNTSDPLQMIFTGADYDKFYSKQEHLDFIRNIWKNDRLLVVGFGFSDPFLTHIAERALQTLPSDLRHFALIGHSGQSQITPMQRRLFANKYRLEPIFYQIRQSADGSLSDHSELQAILGSWVAAIPSTKHNNSVPTQVKPTSTEQNRQPASPAAAEFEKHLSHAPSGRVLYVEPRLMYPASETSEASQSYCDVSVDQIVLSDSSYFISALPEAGASTLCRRLHKEFLLSGKNSYLARADDLPNYRKKLLEVFQELPKISGSILILDDFDPENHERLIKEIMSLAYFDRYIFLSSHRLNQQSYSISNDYLGLRLIILTLQNLENSAIRVISKQLFDTADEDLLSSVVEKSYLDLTELCVPLTPSNVIMYITILHREGDFHPLNRVDIIERYVSGLLKRPSDLYSDAFNFKSRIDVISSFVYRLYTLKKTDFLDSDWASFCDDYMESTLVSFDKRKLLTDLISARIVHSRNGTNSFKYKLFYCYFLGLFIARKPALLDSFIATDDFLAIEGIVEIICGVSIDATQVVEQISARLRTCLQDFNRSFAPINRDPFTLIEWPIRSSEEEQIWQPLAAKLAEGPATPGQFDKLKRSLLAEKRTEDQRIVIREFGEVERRLVAYHEALVDALRSSDTVSGPVKMEAVRLSLESHFIVYQVGLIYAPLIAKYDFYNWNGLIFNNQIPFSDTERADKNRTTFIIMSAMSRAVAERCAASIGMKKLGEVFRVLSISGKLNDFVSYSNYFCLISAKSHNWHQAAENIIKHTDRKSFYLKSMLSSTFDVFFKNVNTGSDRDKLKRLIALIRTKRELKKENPGSKLVGRVLSRLEQRDVFKSDD